MSTRFFEKRRVSAYFQSGALKKDKKTGRRFWVIKLAVTMDAHDAQTCSEAILSNFQQIEARENSIDQIGMGSSLAMMVLFFEDKRAKRAELRLDECILDGLYMTHENGTTELWFTLDHENTDQFHAFVKDYAFTRFCMEFLPTQRTLADAAANAAESFQRMADEDGISTTLSTGGETLVEFKPQGKKKD